MRLISADEASATLKALLYETAMNNDGWFADACVEIAENRVDIWIGLVPTVDPVKHGRWEMYDTYKQTIDGRTFDGWCECSECRTLFPWGFSTYNYCPNCGACLMDEVEE